MTGAVGGHRGLRVGSLQVPHHHTRRQPRNLSREEALLLPRPQVSAANLYMSSFVLIFGCFRFTPFLFSNTLVQDLSKESQRAPDKRLLVSRLIFV